MPCYEIDGVRPVVHPTAYVHPDAVLIGDVFVDAGCYVAPRGFVALTLAVSADDEAAFVAAVEQVVVARGHLLGARSA